MLTADLRRRVWQRQTSSAVEVDAGAVSMTAPLVENAGWVGVGIGALMATAVALGSDDGGTRKRRRTLAYPRRRGWGGAMRCRARGGKIWGGGEIGR